MAYILTYSLGSLTVNDTTLNTQTSLSIPGLNYEPYGAPVDQNFVWLLENFAAPNQPANPIPGQTWYNTDTRTLNLNISDTSVASWVPLNENLNPGGPNNSIQYNSNEIFTGSSSLTFDPAVGIMTVDGNVVANYFIGSGGLQTALLTTGSDATGGVITGIWTLSGNSTLRATYADLAEKYVADRAYPAGTVLEFGGSHEVTLAQDETRRVAGVVSTDPAYVMNDGCLGDHVVLLAMIGRVPCRVRGTIHKGDLLCSAGDGYARPTHSPKVGTIIGKALEDYDGVDGVIEIVVGKV